MFYLACHEEANSAADTTLSVLHWEYPKMIVYKEVSIKIIKAHWEKK